MKMKVPSLNLSGLRIQHCHELWFRSQTRLPALLWRKLAAVAPIRPLAWEPPYAKSAALKRKNKTKQNWRPAQSSCIREDNVFLHSSLLFPASALGGREEGRHEGRVSPLFLHDVSRPTSQVSQKARDPDSKERIQGYLEKTHAPAHLPAVIVGMA